MRQRWVDRAVRRESTLECPMSAAYRSGPQRPRLRQVPRKPVTGFGCPHGPAYAAVRLRRRARSSSARGIPGDGEPLLIQREVKQLAKTGELRSNGIGATIAAQNVHAAAAGCAQCLRAEGARVSASGDDLVDAIGGNGFVQG